MQQVLIVCRKIFKMGATFKIAACPLWATVVLWILTNFTNRPFHKIAEENSNKLKLKTYTGTRKNTFALVTLQSFSISAVISAEKM